MYTRALRWRPLYAQSVKAKRTGTDEPCWLCVADAGIFSCAHEAVGLEIDRFRRCEHVGYDPRGLHEFIVESREPGTQHRLTRNTFDKWLRRPGGSPADVALKARLKELLCDVA